jgi:hypothetical protein
MPFPHKGAAMRLIRIIALLALLPRAAIAQQQNAPAINLTSTLVRPANTTAYAGGQLIASSTTAGSIVVPKLSIQDAAGDIIIAKFLLTTNVTTGWVGAAITLNLWSAVPTYTNGDGGAYAVATGSAGYLGQLSCTFAQAGDGAYAECVPALGTVIIPKLANGGAIFWDMSIGGAATPISVQTFTISAIEKLN